MTANETEMWKPVLGFEGWYEVSNQGRVRSWRLRGHRRHDVLATTPNILKPGYRREYKSVHLTLDGLVYPVSIHVAVLEAFTSPRPEGMHAAHLDGDCLNNRATNLAWVTPTENIHHKWGHKTMARGERMGNARLTDAGVLDIRSRWAAGETIAGLAREYRVGESAVRDCVKNKTWRHVVAPARLTILEGAA